MERTYASKVDLWLRLVIVALILVSSISLMTALTATSGAEMLWALLPAVFGIALPLWVLAGTEYTISPQLLTVKSGPFKWRIPIEAIVGVTPTSSPLSGPALSLDRLRIEYGSGRVIMVSPDDKEGFLEHLERVR